MKPTIGEIMAAAEADDNLGFCIACGAEASGVEPDARNYVCESCGERKVFGAEELHPRPDCQGGLWYTAEKMRIIRELP